MNVTEGYLNLTRGAEYVGRSRKFLWRLKNEVGHFRRGPSGHIMFRVKDLDSWMERSRVVTDERR